MGESEWLGGKEPRLLLRMLRRSMEKDIWSTWLGRRDLTPRKWTLFACACVRRAWPYLGTPARRAIEIAEALADAPNAGREGWAAARNAVTDLHAEGMPSDHDAGNAVSLASYGGAFAAMTAGHARIFLARTTAAKIPGKPKQAARRVALRAEAERQCDLIREVFGNPFRPVILERASLAPGIVSLAEMMYAENVFNRMPELGRLLREGGCDRPDILNHCQGDAPHVRGCWVVDLVLGKS